MAFGIASVSAIILTATHTVQAVTCTPTGFIRDAINLTARYINPTGVVSGDADGTGCNIVVYYGPGAKGTVYGANVHGANYFGVVNNGGNVNVLYSSISDIGELPANGDQHGVAIYFAFGQPNQGSVIGNNIWYYQKAGIVINGSKNQVEVGFNTVTGRGAVNFIAQNGIQIGYGTKNAFVHDNFVSGNSYSGANLAASGGILLVGGDCYGGPLTTNASILQNKLVGNDVGVWLSNLDASCNPSSVLTRDTVSLNGAVNNGVYNTTGNGPTQGYQAGISDQGDGDIISFNDTCGSGYTGGISPAAALYTIDVTLTNSPVVKKNAICLGPDPLPAGTGYMIQASPVR